MAEAAVDSMDCLLCVGECVQPVTLGCEHRFCCSCLREHWAPSDSGDCPTCKRRWSKDLPHNFASEKRDLSQSSAESSEEMEEDINICHLNPPSALQKSTTCAQTSQMSPRILKSLCLNPKQKPVTPAKKPCLKRRSDPTPTSGTKENVPKVPRNTKSWPCEPFTHPETSENDITAFNINTGTFWPSHCDTT